jgi:hypothetical protein
VQPAVEHRHLEVNMQFRTISYLVAALLVSACGTASDPTGSSEDGVKGGRKKDGGHQCDKNILESAPCPKADSGRDPGNKGPKSDAGKGRDDADDDDDDDDDDGGGKGGGKSDGH